MSDLILEFSNSNFLTGYTPESMTASQKKQIGFVQVKVNDNSGFTGIRLLDEQEESVIDLEIPFSGGVWSTRKEIATGHKIIDAKVSKIQGII